MSLLRIEGLSVTYGKAQALREVSFEIDPGEYVAVIGPNGAGKTTLLNALSGLVPYRGEIQFLGAPLPHLPHEIVQDGLVHCPEGRNLFPYLSVYDNLRIGAYLRHDHEIDFDLQAVLDFFPRLKERADQWVHTLSGGEQQMVAIGRALMGRPRLLMLDEPTLGLAPQIRAYIANACGRIRERYGLTMLVAEQNVTFAFEQADRIYLLETGQIVREGSPEELREDRHVRQVYLGR